MKEESYSEKGKQEYHNLTQTFYLSFRLDKLFEFKVSKGLELDCSLVGNLVILVEGETLVLGIWSALILLRLKCISL